LGRLIAPLSGDDDAKLLDTFGVAELDVSLFYIMSFFSSLLFIYPLETPTLTAADIKSFTTRLFEAGICRPSNLQYVRIDYGSEIDTDIDIEEDEDDDDEPSVLLISTENETWDHQAEEGAWADLWPPEACLQKTVSRASVCMGWLTKPSSNDLTSQRSPDDWNSSISPDMISFTVGPALTNTLASEEPICPGFISVRLSGNGYFTWQPLDKYWNQIKVTSTVMTLMRICKEFIPAQSFEFGGSEQAIFSELFLNADDRETGDWIVSVAESG
jgi:hypothetical protein